ncbi:MAG: hypothetical protein QOE95_1988, partial [Gaiellaceae bacterium]|nr:hypothetical protein [Gaiellaceae bacterium]
LYSGHLLQDFVLDVLPFDEWLSEQRTRLAFKAAAVFQQLVSLYNRDGRAAEAIRIAERWVEIDFLNEPAQRLLLRQLASYKGKEAALNHASGFVEQLRQQLSTRPEPETIRLLDEIRSGHLRGAAQAAPIGARQGSNPPLLSEGERKLEDTHTLLGAILPGVKATIEKYDGTLSQALPDGFAAIFGAPTSHEDHAVRASCAALELHEQLALQGGSQPVRFRVGISSGEVVLKPLGGDSGQCYSVIGSAYQIASLVHQLAAPGMTILTHLTHELGQGVLKCAVRPPLSLTSYAKPLQLHELIGVDANRPRLQEKNIVPLVGRGRQLTQLCGLAEQVSKGEGGRVVAVIGDAGIGKSRLCYEFSELLKLKRWRVLQARTASLGQPAPLNTFISLLRGLLDILPEEDKAIVQHKVRSRMRSDDANRFFVPAILSLLGVASESDIWEQLEPTEKRRHTSEAIVALLLRESTSGPIMILIEDMHWLLFESKMLLDTLVSRITPGRLLVVVNYRSG